MISYADPQSIHINHAVSRSTKEGDFQTHHHLFYEILFIVNGSGVFLIEDSACEFSGNTVFLIPPQQYHVLKVPPQRNYERYIINFSPDILPEALQTAKPVIRQADENILDLFQKTDAYRETFQGEPLYWLQRAVITELMAQFCYGKAGQYVPRAELPPLVQSAIHYIGDNLDRPLDASLIAEALFVSKTYLSHVFAKTMNISLMRYVRMKKIYRAREYLKQGNSVTRTAELLGYDSYHTFLRNYYAEFHISPSEDKRLSDAGEEHG